MTQPHGMLFVATNIDAADEADFNQWYDHEHVEERVAIGGFLSGTRYQAIDAERKYLGLYETESLETFTSADYHAAFTRQTEWSVKNLNKMVNPMRRVCAITHQHGKGSASNLAVMTLKVDLDAAALTAWQASVAQTPGYIASRLLTPDTALSTPLPCENREHRPMDVMLLLTCSDAHVCATLAASAAQTLHADVQLYSLSWQLTKQEIAHG
ncbi:DUF4286 family protein [Dickeya solani]|uniref:DUF4286 family protein n=2 Tax=Dickeya solani TaxID=1089444 RepID=A0AAP3G8E5_9GAMM|nr:DUF4286 family protein [Dickeya solani]ANE77063.1 hypothetical protein A4U42_18020 [Dickeya solani IPO 2222]AUC44824.1 hypothetical protein D083_4476 [Dickeya solani RNS 08.23.3.1.A]AUH07525.1 hypothetical protein BJD21_03010 [Dickeya solani D s0432-1]AUH11557.1 hypothetical protein BJJ98_02975 [Dickeya solani]AYQ47631.1 hypothetical protein CTB91_01819 [Dickeya solani]